jgi:NADH dehydrogenase [ubiquinone] 1 alpha subcomplex assembly factor 7
VFSHLGQLDGVSVHLVELSPRLQDAQAKRLCSEVTMSSGRENLHFASGTTHAGCPVYWHHAFSEVPSNAFSCVLAHEFFDALPVHKLQVIFIQLAYVKILIK